MLALLPADSRAADLLVGQAGVEGNFRHQGFERLGRRVDSRLVAEAEGQFGEPLPPVTGVARVGDARTDALDAAVGVGDGALLLGVRLAGKEHVRLAARGVSEHPDLQDEIGGAQGCAPAIGIGKFADRIDVPKDQRVELLRLERVADLRRAHALRGLGEAGACGRQAADLAQAARVASLGHLEEARAVGRQVERVGACDQRREGALAVGTVTDPFAVDDHGLAGPERSSDPLGILATGATRGAGELCRKVRKHRRCLAGRVAKRFL